MESAPINILLTDKDYLLQKFPGKGGWTFAAIDEVAQDKHAWFGWVKVSGSIDSHQIENYHLMPMGNGTLMLPVKSEIRKKIGKNEGDVVHVVLYSTDLPPVETDDLMICLKDDSVAYGKFIELSEKEQSALKDWIFAVKNDTIKIERIARLINQLNESNTTAEHLKKMRI
jgi:Domain of unknown function (DUF1905).